MSNLFLNSNSHTYYPSRQQPSLVNSRLSLQALLPILNIPATLQGPTYSSRATTFHRQFNTILYRQSPHSAISPINIFTPFLYLAILPPPISYSARHNSHLPNQNRPRIQITTRQATSHSHISITRIIRLPSLFYNSLS